MAPGGAVLGARADREAGRDRRPDRQHAAADEDLGPGQARRVEDARRGTPDVARTGETGEPQRLARMWCGKVRRGKPAQALFRQHRSVVPGRRFRAQYYRVVAAFAGRVEGGREIARRHDPHLRNETGPVEAEPPQQSGEARPSDMVADAEAQAGRHRPRDLRQRAVMRLQKPPGRRQELRTLSGHGDVPRRPVEEARAEPVLQTLEAQADRCLRSGKRLGGTREAAEIGHPHEGQDTVEIERRYGHKKMK